MSLTRPLTRPLTRKISRAEITQGYGGSFSPLLLNPYLLFDARESMVGTLENPTLDLNPALPETLDVITAIRSGTATYTDANGNIATAAADTVRVDYTQGEELTPTKFQRIGYTDFSSGVTLDGVTKTNQSTPYGDGVLLTQDTSSGEHNINISVTSTGQHTFSLKVKPNGVTKFSLSLEFSTSNSEVVYDTVLETSGIQGSNVSDASIENLGNGWFLAKLTNDSAVSTARVRLRDNSSKVNYLGDGASGLFLANPQVEEGTTASDFVANTTGSPKFITGATYGPRVPMMLIEPSATNLLPYSEDFSQWNTDGASVTVDYGYLSPRGDLTASKVTQQNSNGHLYFTGITGAKSIYIKGTAGETVNALDRYTDANTSITLTGEWQRVELDGVNVIFYAVDFRGGTATEVYIWGAQLETGSVATSYIPTSGSTVTRQADDLVMSGSDFTDFYNATEGTVYTEAVGRGYFDFNSVFAISDNSFNESIYQRTPSNNQVLVVIDGGNVQANLTSSTTQTGTLVRRAGSFKLNNFKGSHDGVDTNSDTSGTIPTVDRLLIGASASADNKLNGHIKRLIYWPYSSDNL